MCIIITETHQVVVRDCQPESLLADIVTTHAEELK